MGETSAIEWTDATFNPWWGCTRVSPGCDNCYADTWAHRVGFNDLWDGPKRRTFGVKHWAEPLTWNRRAQKESRRIRVFCASMADVFDKDAPERARQDLWELIEDTAYLDWLLLTKRIGNAPRMFPDRWRFVVPRNLWLGISVVNQEEADRDIPKLLETPAPVRFLSCEPLLGPIEFPLPCRGSYFWSRMHWVIVGGESGQKARPMDEWWAVHIRQQCEAAGVAFFMKQGSQANWPGFKDFARFPAELQVRQWPKS